MKNPVISTVIILICFAFNLQAQPTEMIAVNTSAPITQLEPLSQNGPQNALYIKR